MLKNIFNEALYGELMDNENDPSLTFDKFIELDWTWEECLEKVEESFLFRELIEDANISLSEPDQYNTRFIFYGRGKYCKQTLVDNDYDMGAMIDTFSDILYETYLTMEDKS